MAIFYQPAEILKKIAPKKRIEKLVTQKLSLNRIALQSVYEMGVLKKGTLEKVALKVIKNYRKRYGDERKQGASKVQAREEALNNKKQIVQRVRNATVREISKEIGEQYDGERYRWLPSSANEADPLHQLNYGKIFTIGIGEMPGEREGCQCGMEILVDETELEL